MEWCPNEVYQPRAFQNDQRQSKITHQNDVWAPTQLNVTTNQEMEIDASDVKDNVMGET